MIRQVRVGLLLTIATTTLALLLPCIAQAGPIGYWSLDGTLADSSGNDQHGTVGGTAGSFAEIYANDAPAQLGQRQSFEFNDATAIYLPFLDTYHKSHTTGTTVSMWIKAERQGDARLFGEGYTGSDRPFYAIETLTDGKLRWYIRAWTNPPGTATQLLADTTAGVHLEASNPQWHHLLWTDEHVGGDQHDLKVYVDGVHDKTFTYNWQDSSLDRTTLGGIHAGNIRSMIEGRMADVAVWDRVLGAAYIEDLAKGTRGRCPRPCLPRSRSIMRPARWAATTADWAGAGRGVAPRKPWRSPGWNTPTRKATNSSRRATPERRPRQLRVTAFLTSGPTARPTWPV